MNSANVSKFYKHSYGLVQYSNDGKFIAIAKDNQLFVRDATGFSIHHVYRTLDLIQVVKLF